MEQQRNPLRLWQFIAIFSVELSLIIAETSEKVTCNETDIERISPIIQRTEVRIESAPPTFVGEEFEFVICYCYIIIKNTYTSMY